MSPSARWVPREGLGCGEEVSSGCLPDLVFSFSKHSDGSQVEKAWTLLQKRIPRTS